MRGSSLWPRGSPQLASRPAQPSRPLRAGAHGVTRRGARGPGRGAGESQPERAGRCRRARAGGQEVRAEGAERAEPPGEEEDGEGGRRGRPRPHFSEPAPRHRRARSLCLFASGRLLGCVHRGPGSPIHGASANARPPGGRHRLEPRTPTRTPEERTRERGAAAALTPRGDPGGAGREPRGSAGPDGAATRCARWSGPRGGQP